MVFSAGFKKEQAETVKSNLEISPENREWLPAEVPGSVHLDLLRNGKIDDPFLENNESDVQWVEDKDWIYKNTFTLSPEKFEQLRNGRNLELQLDGLDNYCTIFINRQKIATVNNMFVPRRFEITGMVKEDRNELLLFFDSPRKITSELEKKYGKHEGPFDQARVYSRRAQYFTGWDWGPRLSGVGAWRSVRLVIWDHSMIMDASTLTLDVSKNAESADLLVQTSIRSCRAYSARLKAEILLEGKVRKEFEKNISLKSGDNTIEEKITIEEPSLWRPVNHGAQTMYDLRVTLFQEKKKIHSKDARFGIRKVRLLREDRKSVV